MTIATTTVPGADIMERLRHETRSAHDATEAIPFSAAMVQHQLPRERYIAQLACYLLIHRALDRALAESNEDAVQRVWLEDMHKAALLEQDLAYLTGGPVESPADHAPDEAVRTALDYVARIEELADQDPPALLGHLYVLEGSTLGATILRGHIAEAFGIKDQGLAYYSPYGNEVMPHWRAFKHRMNAAVTDPADQERVIEAARDAFERIGQVLHALSADLAVADPKSGDASAAATETT